MTGDNLVLDIGALVASTLIGADGDATQALALLGEINGWSARLAEQAIRKGVDELAEGLSRRVK